MDADVAGRRMLSAAAITLVPLKVSITPSAPVFSGPSTTD